MAEKPAHIERMLEEYEELKLRCIRLSAYISGPDFVDLPLAECTLMVAQYNTMVQYRDILQIRLTAAGEAI